MTTPVADYNRDGQLDLFAVEWEPSLPSILFSGTTEGNWIEIGVAEMHRAPAAQVAVYKAGRSGDIEGLLSLRPLSTSRGYASGSELIVHSGLGSITTVDVVVTLVDGTTYEAAGLAANSRYLLPNGCG